MSVTRWSRELWDRAGKATQCPLCPDPGDPGFNARGCTITVPQGPCESTVVWEPCGHTVVVEDRLVPPLDPEEIPA